MDRSLDEILAERQKSKRGGPRNNRGGSGASGRRERQDYPRDGVRKSFRDDAPRSTGGQSFRDDAPRNLDSEWVHDRYDGNDDRRSTGPRRQALPDQSRGSKIRVDNIHYELTEDDLDGLFNKIGPVERLELRYDRAGRSEGTAFVTYESNQDALRAIREYDGANAAGQPIRLTMMPTGPTPRRNPFDTAVMPSRPLSERISHPSNQSRSLSPARREGSRKGGDNYRPGGSGSRSRSPLPSRRREGGRRPGARGRGGGDGGGGGNPAPRNGREGRLKKTQEELDAEMEDYFGNSGAGKQQSAAPAANGAANAGVGREPIEDMDMIE
ncbi:hypothetical protein QBC33DRAFT_531543 [Phialemonium atrogriseum]|uniref:RRM domain-containing protein n=1 Tax=Phialemonium atrogriseum TaxID=1093897 RepID=A0AAJ0FNW1_9PEZI|nr:uncharacterized protein QBC33DRAFT_531543 [Phialemonium atrogriseum]KAK1769663.1 hypothetical protein QBC33DRAFT_531543 [Phialemonium atrogriseum]